MGSTFVDRRVRLRVQVPFEDVQLAFPCLRQARSLVAPARWAERAAASRSWNLVAGVPRLWGGELLMGSCLDFQPQNLTTISREAQLGAHNVVQTTKGKYRDPALFDLPHINER